MKAIQRIWRKGGAQKEGEAPKEGDTPNESDANTPTGVRLELERRGPGLISGWAATAQGVPAALQLVVQGQPLDLPIRRISRADVHAVLGEGGEGAKDYGFELWLPSALASLAAQNPASLRWQVDGEAVDFLAPPSLKACVDDLRTSLGEFSRERELAWLIAHVAASGGPDALLDAQDAAWLREVAAVRGWQSHLTEPSLGNPCATVVAGQIESLNGLTLWGWVARSDGPVQRIALRCNGVLMDAGLIRVGRQDVTQAHACAGARPGFEIELPSDIWADADALGVCRLDVWVDGVLLPGGGVTLTSERLLTHWAALAATSADAQSTAEFQYQVMLALEHLAGGRLLAGLSKEHQAFAHRQAQRFGLSKLVAGAPREGGVTAAPAVDQSSEVLLWRLQKQFNGLLIARDASLSQCLEELLQETAIQGALKEQFLITLIPIFSGRRQFAELRPHLPSGWLRRLTSRDDAWALSILLPELICRADYLTAIDVLQRLTTPSNWLNTECVGEAVERLRVDLGASSGEDDAAKDLVLKLVALFSSIANNHWSRLHDWHLVDAHVSLLIMADQLPDHVAYEVRISALRLYTLVPSFWEILDRRWPASLEQPSTLRDARRIWTRLSESLQSPLKPGDALSLLPHLRMLRGFWGVDVDQVVREILQCAVAGSVNAPLAKLLAAAMFSEAEGLAYAEPLRLAAHPLWPPELLAQAPDLSARIRTVSGVPVLPAMSQRVRVLGMLRGLPARAVGCELALSDCRKLAVPAQQFVGVLFATWRWCLLHPSWTEWERTVELAELRALWVSAWQRANDGSPPPAALCSALNILRIFASASSDVEQVVRHWSHFLSSEDVQALAVPAVQNLQLQSAHPLARTLVVVYSCRANLSTRVRLIRDTWGRDLSARGIPWLVAVGDGQGFLEGDGVLGLRASDAYEDLPAKSLALAEWVWSQTDFDHFYKIDDDCHLSVEAFFDQCPHLGAHFLGRVLNRSEGATDRLWHQAKSRSPRGAHSVDKSPEPSCYADGGTGYLLSRLAMGRLRQKLHSVEGARMTRSAFMEDKLIGDLLGIADIRPTNIGYETLLRRRHGPNAVPVNSWQNTYYPGLYSPVLLSHLDDAGALPAVHAAAQCARLLPAKIWPTPLPPQNLNQLELLSDTAGVRALCEADVLVVAVARNERVLMPHFLDHYRKLGVRHFVLIDNLSDDGTREYLLAQGDVVLYSADSEYKDSQFGVAWQQAVLAAHGLGRWVLLADIDEFLVYQGCEHQPLAAWLAEHEHQGAEAVAGWMVDMYPAGPLSQADFAKEIPFKAAPYFDRRPLQPWLLGSGWYSNGPTMVSALRHRLIPDSAPNQYTSQKLMALRYKPWVRLAQGLHYASGVKVVHGTAWFAHFKYHAGFEAKVREEIARKQHFNGAEEYVKYAGLIREAGGGMYDADVSVQYCGSQSFSEACIGLVAESIPKQSR